jgi:hypothetical protein
MTTFGKTLSLALGLVVLVGAGFLLLRTPVPTLDTNPAPVVKEKCYIGGCSGQICSDQEGVASDCMYRPEYTCYKTATCERQSSGQCGWTETPALQACLTSSLNAASGSIFGHVTIGPNCPVEQEGKPCPTPPETYTSREAIVYGSDSVTVKDRIHLSTEGSYMFTLPAGQYYVQISPAGIGEGEKKPAVVKADQTTEVNFDIDTGIR